MITLDQAGRDLARTTLLPPPADLLQIVEYLWVERAPELAASPCRIVADPSAHLIFTARSDGAGGTLRLVGPRSVFVDIDKAHRHLTVGARLVPGALGGLFGLPADSLADRSVNLGEAVGRPAVELASRLVDADCASSVVEALISHLRQRKAAGRVADWRIQAAHGLLSSNERLPALRDLAAATGNAPRTLRQVLRTEVGLGWRRWGQIHRLSKLLHRALEAPSPHWADLAVAIGYCDQAHLIREHRRLLGETPAQFLRRAQGGEHRL